MRKFITVLLLLTTQISFSQSDNFLNWENRFPQNEERAKNKYIYCDNVKLSYDKTLVIKSSGGGNNVNESNLRYMTDFVRTHIYDADIEMKFTFDKGASPEAAVGMAFTTHISGSGRLISYRFLLSADGHFYTHIDSAEYSDYKKDLRQFKSKSVTPKLVLDGSENSFVISRHHKYWSFTINGQEVDRVPDYRYYPFNPANGIRFLFVGKYTMRLNTLKEDYALTPASINDELKKAKLAEGTGYKVENLNTKLNDVVDTNASVMIDVFLGDIQATISSAALGGAVKIRIEPTSDGTYEKNKMPAMIGEYEVTEFTLDAERKNWYLKASKKEHGNVEVEKSIDKITTSSTITTTTLWFHGTK